MTKVTITHKVAGHQVGDTLDTSSKAAQYLVDAGYADVLVDGDKPKRGRPSKAEAKSTDTDGTND